MTEAVPDDGRFCNTEVRSGASNVNTADSVPATAPTVRLRRESGARSAFKRHAADVADVQADVMQLAADSDSVDVNSYVAKLSPVTVTHEPPELAPFRKVLDATGASKLIPETNVPATAATVREMGIKSEVVFEPPKQLTPVAEDHAAVTQAEALVCILAVKSSLPKLSPLTVTDEDPLDGTLRNPCEPTGASNVKDNPPVPAIAPTVKIADR